MQRCWAHRIANVLDKLPTRLQPKVKRALHAMMYAESRTTCEAVMQRFTQGVRSPVSQGHEGGAGYGRATAVDALRLLGCPLEAYSVDQPD